jgi:hypothetical protein
MDRNSAALKAADTLHNARFLRDFERDRLQTSQRFNCTIEQNLWWYGAVTDVVIHRGIAARTAYT